MPPSLRCMQTSRARHGFTMVELVIVLAVVSVLAGLIIPSLMKARNQAAAAQCLDNCRALGQAFVRYSHDHEGQLVPFSLPCETSAESGEPTELLWPELLGKHAKEHQSWHCPECRDGTHGGLAYNRLLASRGITMGQLVKPSQTVVFGDAGPVANPEETNPDQWRESKGSGLDETDRVRFAVPNVPSWQPAKTAPVRMVNRHGGRASTIFADGRAVRLPVSQIGFQHEAGDARALWDNQ